MTRFFVLLVLCSSGYNAGYGKYILGNFEVDVIDEYYNLKEQEHRLIVRFKDSKLNNTLTEINKNNCLYIRPNKGE